VLGHIFAGLSKKDSKYGIFKNFARLLKQDVK
jgi:hypothetical protein